MPDPEVAEPVETTEPAAESPVSTDPSADSGQTPESTATTTVPMVDAGGRPIPDATPAGPTPEGTPPAPEPTFQEQVVGLGENFADVADEETARTRLLEQYQATTGQMNELRARAADAAAVQEDARRYHHFVQSPEYQNYLQFARQQAAGQPSGVQAVEEKDDRPTWWRPPKIDSDALARYSTVNPQTGEREWMKDSTGAYVAPPEFRNQVQDYQMYREKWIDGLTTRPHEVLPEIIKEVGRELFSEMWQENRSSENVLSFATDINERHGEWMYEHAPNGQLVYDFNPASGRNEPRWSQHGQMVNHYVQQAASYGINDPTKRWEYATEKAHYQILLHGQGGAPAAGTPGTPPAVPAAVPGAVPPAAQTPEQIAEQRKADHLAKIRGNAGGNAGGGSGGSVPRGEVPGDLPQNAAKQTFEQVLRRNMNAEGLSEVPALA